MTDEMLEDDEIVVRPELMAFAVAMEGVMRSHDGDYGNSYKRMKSIDCMSAMLTIHRRTAEIDREIGRGGHPSLVPNLAARIGCYAMFFHHHFAARDALYEKVESR